MQHTITSEIVVAYSQCPQKAFLLLCTDEQGIPHEYMRMLEQQKQCNQINYLHALTQTSLEEKTQIVTDFTEAGNLIIKATLKSEGLEAYCDVLTRVESSSSSHGSSYEPTIVVGTHSINKEQKLELLFAGYVLGKIQGQVPEHGKVIGAHGISHQVKLGESTKILLPLLQPLQKWTAVSSPQPPPLVLNKHCPTCLFRDLCQARAEKEDNLSLLASIKPKDVHHYEKKGIFTVKQLSYVYKPRRPSKRAKNPQAIHKPELQALAVRTGKIYLQHTPTFSRQAVELFFDIEGIPDQQFYYLIGLLVCQDTTCAYHAFWADTDQEEGQMWSNFLGKVSQYPNAPLYHYGSYEPRAIVTLSKRHGTESPGLEKRLININASISGKVYFPVQSNGLKEIGKFLGARWTAANASGLQSLVWRYYWDTTGDRQYQSQLVTYNQEDCLALKVLVDELSNIKESAQKLSHVDFIDQPKRLATQAGEQIHSRFEAILKFAHADYEGKKIRIRSDDMEESTHSNGRRGYASHQGYTIPRATKVIHVPQRATCPKCGDVPLKASSVMAERTITDLAFSKNGCRKTVTKYVRPEGYCPKCCRYYSPEGSPDFPDFHLYGHGLQAWAVYQRLVLRLPYRLITQAMEDLFHVHISGAIIVDFLNGFARYYADTERLLIQHMLTSPFIHADETQINIQGVDHYVWVFTDGTHVVFRMTETREAVIVHEFLSDYQGILISDFYPGYDAVKCRQQKCLVHLIRDLNDDLWKSPFDGEFEAFVLEVKNLLVPMLEAVQKYGLKKRHLHKFSKQIDQFYERVITDRAYHSDLAIKYQSRFRRYRQSLFTFIEHDGIPWNNNMAERAIRHLAVQRKISGTFFKSVAPQYLLMLGITQTCRFQEKSLLKFLMSGENDIDTFKAAKPLRGSMPVNSFDSPEQEESTIDKPTM